MFMIRDVGRITVEKVDIQELIHGKWYAFDEPQRALALPTAEIHVCEPEICTFARGLYKGKARGSYVFEGKPDNDERRLSLPENIRNHKTWAEAMRNCYFHIAPEKISGATLEPNQD